MSRQTTNYGYNISEGTDLVNPLVDIFPNWEAIDSDLKDVSDDAVGRATELTTGTVHALTRSDTDRNVFVFTATSNFTAGDTFTLDGTQVSALTPAGEQLATGCYIIGSDVLVAVHGTLMTMYVSPTKVADSDKLDGHDSTYFATASGVSDLSDDLDAVSDKVGTGVLTTTAQDCVGAINELNSDLNKGSVSVTADGVKTLTQILDLLFALADTSKITINSKLRSANEVFSCTLVGGTVFDFSSITNPVIIDVFRMQASNSVASRVNCNPNNTILFENRGVITPESGRVFTLYY